MKYSSHGPYGIEVLRREKLDRNHRAHLRTSRRIRLSLKGERKPNVPEKSAVFSPAPAPLAIRLKAFHSTA
jgi:hypothetical protein